MLAYTYGRNGICALTLSLPPLTSLLGALTTWQNTGVKAATPVGNLIGQVLFGWLADVLGRKRMCMSFLTSPS